MYPSSPFFFAAAAHVCHVSVLVFEIFFVITFWLLITPFRCSAPFQLPEALCARYFLFYLQPTLVLSTSHYPPFPLLVNEEGIYYQHTAITVRLNGTQAYFVKCCSWCVLRDHTRRLSAVWGTTSTSTIFVHMFILYFHFIYFLVWFVPPSFLQIFITCFILYTFSSALLVYP